VGALCDRWPKGDSIVAGRSHCAGCNKTIAAYDLVPVISYLILHGKCRNCGQKIGAGTLMVELAAMSIGATSVTLLPAGQALAAAIFGWLLLPLAILDHRHLWLPNRLVLLLVVGGAIMGPLLTPELDWTARAIGAAVGFLSLEVIRHAYKHLRGIDGMGAGDPKLFGVLGIWLGWRALPMTLLAASVLGLGLVLLMNRREAGRGTALPLGSYLAVAAFLVAVLGLEA
jgi:leader peptidase (prepilin peptidase) / N-methyltransferase